MRVVKWCRDDVCAKAFVALETHEPQSVAAACIKTSILRLALKRTQCISSNSGLLPRQAAPNQSQSSSGPACPEPTHRFLTSTTMGGWSNMCMGTGEGMSHSSVNSMWGSVSSLNDLTLRSAHVRVGE